jgi:hypothetical protein
MVCGSKAVSLWINRSVKAHPPGAQGLKGKSLCDEIEFKGSW